MNLEITSSIDYQEMCDQLGIPYANFLEFVKSGGQLSQKQIGTYILTAIEKYIDHLRSLHELNKLANSSYLTYLSFITRFEKYIKSNHADLILDQLDNKIFNEFLIKEKKDKTQKFANRTINTYTAILRDLLNFCYIEHLSDRELKGKFTFKPVEILPRYLIEEHVEMFLREVLQTVHGIRYHALFSFLLGTGCRVSEVSNLRICDFDINNNVIRIIGGKGNKDRNIPIYPKVKNVVLKYLNLTGVQEWKPTYTGYLFSRDYGLERKRKITPRNIARIVETVTKRLEFTEEYTPHSFRHSFAVRCLIAGMKVEYLSQVLGHSSPETTYIYIQLLPKDLQEHIMDKYPFAFEKLMFTALSLEEFES